MEQPRTKIKEVSNLMRDLKQIRQDNLCKRILLQKIEMEQLRTQLVMLMLILIEQKLNNFIVLAITIIL